MPDREDVKIIFLYQDSVNMIRKKMPHDNGACLYYYIVYKDIFYI